MNNEQYSSQGQPYPRWLATIRIKPSIPSLFFSAAILFLVYIIFRPGFLFPWLQNRLTIEGGQEVSTFAVLFMFLAVLFFAIACNIFLLRRIKMWLAVILTIPLLVFITSVSGMVAGRWSDFTLALSQAVFNVVNPFSYLYIYQYVVLFFWSFLAVYILGGVIQVGFDMLTRKSVVASWSIAVIVVVAAFLVANQQISSIAQFHFISTDSMPRADISQITDLRVQFEKKLLGQEQLDIVAMTKDFETQAVVYKEACSGQAKVAQDACDRLYETSISDNSYQLRTAIENYNRGKDDTVKVEDVKIGTGEKIGWDSIVQLCETYYPDDNDPSRYANGKIVQVEVGKAIETSVYYAPALYDVEGVVGMNIGGTRNVYYKSHYSDNAGRTMKEYLVRRLGIKAFSADVKLSESECPTGNVKVP